MRDIPQITFKTKRKVAKRLQAQSNIFDAPQHLTVSNTIKLMKLYSTEIFTIEKGLQTTFKEASLYQKRSCIPHSERK